MGVKLKNITSKRRYDIRVICKSKEERDALVKKFKSLKPCNIVMTYPELLDYLLDKLIESEYNKLHSGSDVENIIKEIESNHDKIVKDSDKSYCIAISYHDREKRNEVKKIFNNITKLAGRKKCNNGTIFEAIIDMVIELNKNKLVIPVEKEPAVKVIKEATEQAVNKTINKNYNEFKEIVMNKPITLKIVNYSNSKELKLKPESEITLKDLPCLISRIYICKNILTVKSKTEIKKNEIISSMIVKNTLIDVFSHLINERPDITMDELKDMKNEVTITVTYNLSLWNKIVTNIFHKKLWLNSLKINIDSAVILDV